jgi:AAT family amino acid transporter
VPRPEPRGAMCAIARNLFSAEPLSDICAEMSTTPNSHEEGLRHQLSPGQMAMVAVGGSIGTGMLLGSAAALNIAGPAVILSYAFAAFVAWTVAMAMGELSSMHPAAGAFGIYADLYLNEWAGFVSRAGFWASISIAIGANLVASATYTAYWFPRIPPLLSIAIFSSVLLLVNLRSVRAYGRFEYWFSMLKLSTMAAFIVVGGSLLLRGSVPVHYTSSGGFFPNGHWAPLLAITFALYTFGGIEIVAITTGEADSRTVIPRAVRLTFAILCIVYLGAIAVLSGVMPWDRVGTAESPFVTVFRTVRIPAAAALMNFVILTAALSGANANLYAGSRILFSLARTGWAPSGLGKLNAAGSPTFALLASSYGVVVALILEKWMPGKAFVYILSAALFGLMLAWLVSLAAHISFRKRLSAEQLSCLPLRSPIGLWGSASGLALVSAAILKSWWDSRVNLFSGVLYLSLLTLAYVLIRPQKCKGQGSSER